MPQIATIVMEKLSSIGIAFLTPEIIASILGVIGVILICIDNTEEMKIALFPTYFLLGAIGFVAHPIALILSGIYCIISLFDPEAIATIFNRYSEKGEN